MEHMSPRANSWHFSDFQKKLSPGILKKSAEKKQGFTAASKQEEWLIFFG